MQPLLVGALIVTATVLGGGTRVGFLGDVIVQIASIALLIVIAARPRASAKWPLPVSWALAGFLSLAVSLPLVQLLPGIPDFVAQSVLRNEADGSLGLIDQTRNWPIVSVDPQATRAALTALLPPIAIVLAMAVMSATDRLRLGALIVGLGATALLLGLIQVAQGPQSELRLFEFTNPTEAVGFFANRNHFATQLCIVLVLTSVWLIPVTHRVLGVGSLNTRDALWLALGVGFMIAIVAGLAMARSRAGLILAMAALLAIVVLALSDRPESGNRQSPGLKDHSKGWSVGRVFGGVAAVAVLFALQFGLHRIMTRLDQDPLEDLRLPLSSTTFDLAWANLPWGTGLGSFVTVYATSERTDAIFSGFANRAHNDLAEVLLELGVAGGLLLAMFFVWLGRQAFAAWSVSATSIGSHHYRLLQKAAPIVILIMLAHSLVDYPLRTTSLACVFAFACGVLLPLPRRSEDEHRSLTDVGSMAAVEVGADRAGAGLRADRGRERQAASAAPPPAVRSHQAWTPSGALPDAWRPSPKNPESKSGAE